MTNVPGPTRIIPSMSQGAAFVTIVGGGTDQYPSNGIGGSTGTVGDRFGLTLDGIDVADDYEVLLESIIVNGATSASAFPYDAAGLDEGVTVAATTMDINLRLKGGLKVSATGAVSSVTFVFRIQRYSKPPV